MSSLLLNDIGLLPAQLKAVQKKAKHAGQTAPEYIRLLVERDLLADKSFDEILKPIRRGFAAAGITEDQLDQIVKRARSAARAKRKARQ